MLQSPQLKNFRRFNSVHDINSFHKRRETISTLKRFGKRYVFSTQRSKSNVVSTWVRCGGLSLTGTQHPPVHVEDFEGAKHVLFGGVVNLSAKDIFCSCSRLAR